MRTKDIFFIIVFSAIESKYNSTKICTNHGVALLGVPCPDVQDAAAEPKEDDLPDTNTIMIIV